MACPTCDHTMHGIGKTADEKWVFWCPRCGTLKHPHDYAKGSPDSGVPQSTDAILQVLATVALADAPAGPFTQQLAAAVGKPVSGR